MPIYKVNGKTYNIPTDKAADFERQFPDAMVDIYGDNGEAYNIPVSVQESFKKKYKNYSYDKSAEESKPKQEERPTPADKRAKPQVSNVDFKPFYTSEAASEDDGKNPRPPLAAQEPEFNGYPGEPKFTPTEEQKAAIGGIVENIKQSVQSDMDEFNSRIENLKEYAQDPAAALSGTTAEGKPSVDLLGGKINKSYLSPTGYRFIDKNAADVKSYEYRQAPDPTIAGQLRRAIMQRRELEKKQALRANELMAQDDAKREGQGIIGSLTEAHGEMRTGKADWQTAMEYDPEYQALESALRQNKEKTDLLMREKVRQDGKDTKNIFRPAREFGKGVWDVLADADTWKNGMGSLKDAFVAASIDAGIPGYDGAAAEAFMQQSMENQQTQAAYGQNDSKWFQWGQMTGDMIPFQLQFALMPEVSVVGGVATKVASKAALNGIGKEAINMIAKEGAKSYLKKAGVKGAAKLAQNWTIKALGTTADELLVRAPLMTNTIQLAQTASDVIGRKLGDVQQDDSGNYSFENGKSWGDALWQGEANSIIENYSEMFGTHLDPILSRKALGKVADTFGAKRISALLSKADGGAMSGIAAQTKKIFDKMEVSGYLGEVSEEYYGQLWRTLLSLDDAYQTREDGSRVNNFKVGSFHGDIWAGMALSLGAMGAVGKTFTAGNYYYTKHKMDKADIRAGAVLGQDTWNSLRNAIDATTNDNAGDLAAAIAIDDSFNDNEKKAAMEYMGRALQMRGTNLAAVASSRDGHVDERSRAYMDGYEASSPQEMNDAKVLLEFHRAKMKRVAGATDQTLDAEEADENWAHLAANAIDGSERGQKYSDTVLDYLNAKSLYSGMMQRQKDDIDSKVEYNNSRVDACTHLDTGKLHMLRFKNGRIGFLIKGQLAHYNDGTGVDIKASDGTLIVRDAETGELSQVSPDYVLDFKNADDPVLTKEYGEKQLREKYAREVAAKVNGEASFEAGTSYTISAEDGTQKNVTVTANEKGVIDNGDGTVNVTDGANVVLIPKALIQQQVDAQNMARVAASEKEREETNAANEQSRREALTPKYKLNGTLTLTDENGNAVRGGISAVNADGIEVYTEAPFNGSRVQTFTAEQLDKIASDYKDPEDLPPATGGAMVEETNSEEEEAPEAAPTEAPEVALDETTAQQVEVETPKASALSQIPVDEKGEPIYEKADPELAWDAVVEQAEGDEMMAKAIADDMVKDKEDQLKKISKSKSKGGVTVTEKIAAEKQRKAEIAAAQAALDHWKEIAKVQLVRKARAAAELRQKQSDAIMAQRAALEQQQKALDEARRKELGDLEGVPDAGIDKASDARERGYRRLAGYKVERQKPIENVIEGKDATIMFASAEEPTKVKVAIVEAEQVQPSHIDGQRNILHFLDEAQPKDRKDVSSALAAEKMAERIRPEQITGSATAFMGAPVVNRRGEAIQGNNRAAALRVLYSNGYEKQAETYKQYLREHAAEFGLNPEDIDKLQHPVLVNMADVDDEEAIRLGQFEAADTESGGNDRIKPDNTVKKMGTQMGIFAKVLLEADDPDQSLSELIDKNGYEAIAWLQRNRFITAAQRRTAFDSKGNLTGEAKSDLRGILFSSIFQGAPTVLREQFGKMPAKAQRAILSTAYRDFDSPESERMVSELQSSIMAYTALMEDADKDFRDAKTREATERALSSWLLQYRLDDATGDSVPNEGKFSNFALRLALMYKCSTQGEIQEKLNRIFDLVQGFAEITLENPEPDITPRTLAQAIKEVLNIDYDGKIRSDLLVGDPSASEEGRQGGSRGAAGSEQSPQGEGNAIHRRGAQGNNGRDGDAVKNRTDQSKKNEGKINQLSMSESEAHEFVADMELNADVAPEITLTIENWDKLFGEDGIVSTPIGLVKMGEHQFTKLMRQGRDGKLGMIKPTLEHPDAIIEEVSAAKDGDTTERASSYIFIRSFKKADGSRYYYFTSVTVSKEGKEVVISNQEKSRNKIVRLLEDGSVIWRTPKDATASSAERQGLDYKQPDKAETATKGSGITPQSTSKSRGNQSPEVGTSSISHAVETAPAISLQSRDDNNSQTLLPSNNSDKHLAEHQNDVPDLLPTQDGNKEKKNNVEPNTEHSASPTASQDKSFVETDSLIGREPADTHSDLQHSSGSEGSAESAEKQEVPEKNNKNKDKVAVQAAESEVDTNPTEAQKTAGEKATESIEEVNKRFNDELRRWASGEMNSNGRIMISGRLGVLSSFIPDLPILLRQAVLRKSVNKHGLSESDLENLPSSLSKPIFIFKRDGESISVLTELEDKDGRNIFVALQLGTNKQLGNEFLDVNDITTIHGREVANIVRPILDNGTLVWADKEKGLNWLSSAKSNSQAITDQDLLSAAKLVENFENPTAYGKKETSEPAISRTDVESNLAGKSDDTATRQDPNVSSADKGSENPENEDLFSMAERIAKEDEAKRAGKQSNIATSKPMSKKENNSVVDEAIAFVTGKPLSEVRKERRQREREWAKETASLYEAILSGEINDVTLARIYKHIDESTPNNPFGRPLFKRLPSRVGRVLYGGQRTNAVDAFFSRAAERAVPNADRKSEEGRRRIEEAKKRALKPYAKTAGIWYESLKDIPGISTANEMDHGTASRVFISADGQYVIKINHGKPYGRRFRPDIDEFALFNSVFPNTKYEIIGYCDLGEGVSTIVRQPAVHAGSEAVSENERVAYMASLGFKPLNEENTAFSNGAIIASDIQKKNIVKDTSGNIRVIDADMKLHTKDVGGEYDYPAVEEDINFTDNDEQGNQTDENGELITERIVKEDEAKRAGKQKKWADMNAQERAEQAKNDPLSEENINSWNGDDVIKANALAYLDGDSGIIPTLAYLKIYEDVRNRTGNSEKSNETEPEGKLARGTNQSSPERGSRGRDGGQAQPVAEQNTEGKVSGSGARNGENSERGSSERDGGTSSGEVRILPSGVRVRDTDGNGISRGSVPFGRGSTISREGEIGQSNGHLDRARGGENTTSNRGGNESNNRDTSRGIDQDLDDALGEFKNILGQFVKAGLGEANLSLIGLNARQIELLPSIASSGAKVGYHLLRKGIRDFKAWAAKVKEVIGKFLKAAGFIEDDIDRFIEEMWNCRLPIDGEVHTIAEWSKEMTRAELRREISKSIEEKIASQQAAESTEVKDCDRENIDKTLPFLYPEQRDDVYKAEIQMLSEEHKDAAHGYGNGILFTNGTGTGKTYTGLGIAKRFIKRGKGRVLIVTPTQTKVSDWVKDASNLCIKLNPLAEKEGKGATMDKGEGAVITTFANFRANQALLEDTFDLVIYDESHRLMESRKATETAASARHYQITNHDFFTTLQRLKIGHPLWREEEGLQSEKKALLKRYKEATADDFMNNLNPSSAEKARMSKIELRLNDIKAEQDKLSPELEEKAREIKGRTKTVFLSATPFNTRHNLEYAEGYVFSYTDKATPEYKTEEERATDRAAQRNSFYTETFPSGEQIKNGKLVENITEPDRLGTEESILLSLIRTGFFTLLVNVKQQASSRGRACLARHAQFLGAFDDNYSPL